MKLHKKMFMVLGRFLKQKEINHYDKLIIMTVLKFKTPIL